MLTTFGVDFGVSTSPRSEQLGQRSRRLRRGELCYPRRQSAAMLRLKFVLIMPAQSRTARGLGQVYVCRDYKVSTVSRLHLRVYESEER